MAPTSFWSNLAVSLGLTKAAKASAAPAAASSASATAEAAPEAAPKAPPPKKKKTPRDLQIDRHIINLKHDNPDMRRSAAWQLGKMKPVPKEAIPALEETAEGDDNEFVRKSATWALKVIREV